jgi:prevent-host-death family protein
VTQVNVLEAKNRLSELVKAAAAGEEVIIANRGVAMVRLVAVDTNPQRGDGPAIAAWLQAHPVPAHARRTVAGIENALSAERDGWE